MSFVVLLCAKSFVATRLWLADVLVAKSFEAVVVCDELDCSAALCANWSVVDVAACCCALREALWAKLLVVAVLELPLLERLAARVALRLALCDVSFDALEVALLTVPLFVVVAF